MTGELVPLIIGLLFMYQWIVGLWNDNKIVSHKQYNKHKCMNQVMEGFYECPHCYPDDYAEGMVKRGV